MLFFRLQTYKEELSQNTKRVQINSKCVQKHNILKKI